MRIGGYIIVFSATSLTTGSYAFIFGSFVFQSGSQVLRTRSTAVKYRAHDAMYIYT